MRLTAVFEPWHLGDGNYPAFRVGDSARLSFEIGLDEIEPAPPGTMPSVDQRQDAEYEFVADVIRLYAESDGSRFPVLEAGWFRFYIPFGAPPDLEVGDRVRIRGRLALDHYLWVEFLHQWADPPDLFYGCRVARIRRVPIPERFVSRTERSLVHPTTVAASEYASEAPMELRAVTEELPGPAFFLLDLDLLLPGTGPDRPSFIGA
ncbi:MAG TPA: hypothetical protein VFZ21_09290 [Gemmatimonadaceae bacterium]|jgi:hypothetical protein|nr:hypothetical protein [Gemmatimonadaceae bacterium]